MRRFLTTLALFLAFGAPAALPAQSAPITAPITAPAAFTTYNSTATVLNASSRQDSSRTLQLNCASCNRKCTCYKMWM